MKFRFMAILSIAAALAAFGKPASTRWETKPHTHKYGVAYRCPFCGQTWGNTPPNVKANEARHISSERRKFISFHLRIVHGKKI